MILNNYKRIIIKIGSSTIIEAGGSGHRRQWLDSIAADIAALKAAGIEIVIVSSGAVALGRKILSFPDGKLQIEEKQAAASTGQIPLVMAYREAFAAYNMNVSQVLLTPGDTENRRRYLNARATLEMLLHRKAIPVINENDTVATEELRFGDNDRLSARVAQMLMADLLIILSDVDGLYTSNPQNNPSAEHIAVVENITPEIEALAEGVGSSMGSGGMATKLKAAQIAATAGCATMISLGQNLHPLKTLNEGARHTLFKPSTNKNSAMKAWIAGSINPSGVVVIDDGAVQALMNGKSLLPAGVASVEGEFERGESVLVKSASGAEIAIGISNYSAADARRTCRRKSAEVEEILGYAGRTELIHRDYLVIHQSHNR